MPLSQKEVDFEVREEDGVERLGLYCIMHITTIYICDMLI